MSTISKSIKDFSELEQYIENLIAFKTKIQNCSSISNRDTESLNLLTIASTIFNMIQVSSEIERDFSILDIQTDYRKHMEKYVAEHFNEKNISPQALSVPSAPPETKERESKAPETKVSVEDEEDEKEKQIQYEKLLSDIVIEVKKIKSQSNYIIVTSPDSTLLDSDSDSDSDPDSEVVSLEYDPDSEDGGEGEGENEISSCDNIADIEMTNVRKLTIGTIVNSETARSLSPDPPVYSEITSKHPDTPFPNKRSSSIFPDTDNLIESLLNNDVKFDFATDQERSLDNIWDFSKKDIIDRPKLSNSIMQAQQSGLFSDEGCVEMANLPDSDDEDDLNVVNKETFFSQKFESHPIL